jgi:membrane protease YdiL (CAAX protease family)
MSIRNILSKILTNVNLAIYLSILGIIAGELLMFTGYVYPGMLIHIINIQAITIAIILGKFSPGINNILQSLLLPLQMRIINLAMPQFFTITLLWYPLVYGVMYISIYYITRHQNITSKEIGINFEHWHIYLPAALLIGAAMAMLEFQILHPTPLILDIKLLNLLLISMVMFVFVGAVEELIFRSILLTRLEKMFGMSKSLILSSLLFGIMHSGYGLITEVFFATFFGVVLGFIFQRTRSFPFILLIHGTANVFLYGVLPIISL